MSEIFRRHLRVDPAQTQAAISDANSPASRGASPQKTEPAAAPAAAPTTEPTDSVELSPAAQSVAAPAATTTLSAGDAQDASVNLRQQIGLYGLSGSLAQNQSVLSLLRRPG